ncbi:MAG TPA: class I SAM-dependent methyltransferase [Dehalococcoidia bacterium]|nr:class I SAM-dependent methyltransferase [Dehalococcoidia bacterium]
MSEDVARHWDERYRREEAEPERGPAVWLVRNVGLLPASGRALDVAMGTGRNALYLASRGYEVTGIDISLVAVTRCRAEAQRRGLRLDAVCADVESYEPERAAYDIVLDFYYLERALCPRLVEALRPGGVLLFETFTLAQRRFGWGPQQEAFLLRPGELRRLFPELAVLAYREEVVEGESDRGPKAVASLLGRKT